MKISLHRARTFVAPALLALCLAGWFWTPHDPADQAFRALAFSGPSAQHWLGVDGLGRDLFSRLWHGAANSVGMGLCAVLATLCGAAVLVFASEAGPRVLRRMVPALIALWVAVPVIFIGLLLLVFLKPSAATLVLAAAIGNVPLAYRQLRVLWRAQRSALYVQSSEVLGARGLQLLRFAIWPNLKPDLAALARLLFAICVLELSGLAFLGLIGDPDFPELGAILKQNQAFLYQSPLLVFLPGAILAAILLSVHLSGQRGRN